MTESGSGSPDPIIEPEVVTSTYQGPDRRRMEMPTRDDLHFWRAGTDQLSREISELRTALTGLVTHEEFDGAKNNVRRLTVFLVALAVGLVSLGLGLTIAGVAYREQQRDFRSSVFESCVLRNQADAIRIRANAVTFQRLIDSIEDPALRESLQEYRNNTPENQPPDCQRLL